MKQKDKIWVVGAQGMLGTHVAEAVNSRNLNCIATDREVDITNPQVVNSFVEKHRPNAIINCAAYTAVDASETNEDAAYLLNERAPLLLAKAAKNLGPNAARLVHVSTDYVFDGVRQERIPYAPEETTSPIGVYGLSKRAGENAIQTCGLGEFNIVRTSWLYSHRANNFVSTMLRLFKSKEEIGVVADQWGRPTYAPDLAEHLVSLALTSANSGISHFSNLGRTSWFGLAEAIRFRILRECAEGSLSRADWPIKRIIPLGTHEYPTPTKRPAFSVLALSQDIETQGKRWDQSLSECLDKALDQKTAFHKVG